MENFENSVGFITGGAAGIGLGVARALGQCGLAVARDYAEVLTTGRVAP